MINPTQCPQLNGPCILIPIPLSYRYSYFGSQEGLDIAYGKHPDVPRGDGSQAPSECEDTY